MLHVSNKTKRLWSQAVTGRNPSMEVSCSICNGAAEASITDESPSIFVSVGGKR